MILNNIYIEDIKTTIKSTAEIYKLKNKSILISGATGLIGSFLVDTLMYLNNNHSYNVNIYALGRKKERLEERFSMYRNNNYLHYIEQDVNDKIIYDFKVDYIIHAASNAHPASITSDPVGTILSNIVGTYNLLEYAKESKAQRFLFISTGEVYGQGEMQAFKEEFSGYVNPIEIRSCYPSSKRTAENLCVSYAKQFDLDTVIVRPCHTYGPYTTVSDNRANVQFINNALKGQDIVLKSKGGQIRSYIYIVDCASAILTVLISGERNQAYNIANKDSILTVAEFAQKVANLSGRKIIFKPLNDTKKSEETPITRAVLDASKLELLGWKAKYNADLGIKSILKILGGKPC